MPVYPKKIDNCATIQSLSLEKKANDREKSKVRERPSMGWAPIDDRVIVLLAWRIFLLGQRMLIVLLNSWI